MSRGGHATPSSMASDKRRCFLGLFAFTLLACGKAAVSEHAEVREAEPLAQRVSAPSPTKTALPAPETLEEEERRSTAEAVESTRSQINSSAPNNTSLPELLVIEHGPLRPWVAAIVNRTGRTYRISANPSLLSLRVQIPGKKEVVTCKLPSSESAAQSGTPSVELKNGEALLYRFDVRSLCFRETHDAVLLPGALVEPHFGWATLKKTRWKKGKREEYTPEQKAPFLVTVVKEEGSEAPEAPNVKELLGPELALSLDYAQVLKEDKGAAEPLALSLERGSNAYTPADVVVAVGIKNRGAEVRRLFFRRELLTFDLAGPRGKVHCEPTPKDRAPDAKAFLTLKPGELVTLPSRMIELCPAGAFSLPGLYEVSATLKAKESGEALGLNAFTGELNANQSAWVRMLRQRPSKAPPMTKFSVAAQTPSGAPEK